MAAHIATILNAQGNTSVARSIVWSSFASGANNIVFPVKSKDASKMIILVASNSTLINSYWIGTSDSRSSGANAAGSAYPYSASKLGRMQIKTTIAAKGAVRSKFRTTVAADTEVYAVFALGPFETARFKDSDGYINVARGKLTAGLASHSSDTHYIAAILIP
jgi:hypothetical protein